MYFSGPELSECNMTIGLWSVWLTQTFRSFALGKAMSYSSPAGVSGLFLVKVNLY